MKFSAVAVLAAALPALASPQGKRSSDTCPKTPKNVLRNDTKLPDPFEFASGQKVTNLKEWQCRQTEVSDMMQALELGVKPPRPDKLKGNLLSNGTLEITAMHKQSNITFSPTITYPSEGSAPYPALIAFDGLSIPTPTGVAIIVFTNDDLALQNDYESRGIGKFYDLYGNNSAGAMTAWAWGVSRIIDILEEMPSAKINTQKIGVTGCSRDGKGALVAGALDDRIALTIPQESGSGGTACWRLSDFENHNGSTQTASEIWTENVWFATTFDQFANSSIDVLPFDHHMLAGLVAPRGLLVIDNIGYEWLGPFSCFECMRTAHKIYHALGVPDHMGISQSPNHSHCEFPSYQQPELDAFIGKFLLDQDTNTTVIKTGGNFTGEWKRKQWIDWTVPKLH